MTANSSQIEKQYKVKDKQTQHYRNAYPINRTVATQASGGSVQWGKMIFDFKETVDQLLYYDVLKELKERKTCHLINYNAKLVDLIVSSLENKSVIIATAQQIWVDPACGSFVALDMKTTLLSASEGGDPLQCIQSSNAAAKGSGPWIEPQSKLAIAQVKSQPVPQHSLHTAEHVHCFWMDVQHLFWLLIFVFGCW